MLQGEFMLCASLGNSFSVGLFAANIESDSGGKMARVRD